jgi:hypothetical protein
MGTTWILSEGWISGLEVAGVWGHKVEERKKRSGCSRGTDDALRWRKPNARPWRFLIRISGECRDSQELGSRGGVIKV